jgi:NAD(P)-dependent dehydrogenase (short-subunit alcohol dehydrogenase family)
MPRTAFILAASADIGQALAGFYLDEGWTVVGTYRGRGGVHTIEGRPGMHLLPCDVGSPDSIRQMLQAYAALGLPWDVFISAVGVLEPIGPWASLDFTAWEHSVVVNSLAQLRVLHGLYPHRHQGRHVHAAFFAGGGTNNPFTNYSAYCVSKIMLIKMCELIDDEVPDVNAFIVGPGFLPTKIHDQTFANRESAGGNYDKTQEFYRSPAQAATYRDLYDCINWCVSRGRDVAGGRNFAAVHDPWRVGGERLAAELQIDRDRYKLRRAGNTGAASEGALTK